MLSEATYYLLPTAKGMVKTVLLPPVVAVNIADTPFEFLVNSFMNYFTVKGKILQVLTA